MQTRGFMSTKGYQVPFGSTLMAQLNAAIEIGFLGTSLVPLASDKYLVHFDDGMEKECPSAVLRVEKVAASLPPDVQLPVPATHVEAVEAEEVQEEVADQDEEEALPEAPEVEEEEVAAEKQAGEEESEEVAAETSDSAPSGMIGQLPTESEVANSTSGKDYATLKKLAWDKVKSLLGNEVVVKTKKNGSMTWKVIESMDNDDIIPEHNNSQYGLKKIRAAITTKVT